MEARERLVRAELRNLKGLWIVEEVRPVAQARAASEQDSSGDVERSCGPASKLAALGPQGSV